MQRRDGREYRWSLESGVILLEHWRREMDGVGNDTGEGKNKNEQTVNAICRTTSSTPSDEESDRSSSDLPPRSLSRSSPSCRSTVSSYFAHQSQILPPKYNCLHALFSPRRGFKSSEEQHFCVTASRSIQICDSRPHGRGAKQSWLVRGGHSLYYHTLYYMCRIRR